MSRSRSRQLRRLARSKQGQVLSEAAVGAFVQRAFKPKPRWMPAPLWRGLLSFILTKEEYNQEFLCSFDAAIRGAYYASELQKARSEGRIKAGFYDKSLLAYTV